MKTNNEFLNVPSFSLKITDKTPRIKTIKTSLNKLSLNKDLYLVEISQDLFYIYENKQSYKNGQDPFYVFKFDEAKPQKYPNLPFIPKKLLNLTTINKQQDETIYNALYEYIKGTTYEDYKDVSNLKNINNQIIDHMIVLKNYQMNKEDKAHKEFYNRYCNYVFDTISKNLYNIDSFYNKLKDHKKSKFLKFYNVFKDLQIPKNRNLIFCLNHNDLHYENIVINNDKVFFIDNSLLDYYYLGKDLLGFIEDKEDVFLLKQFLNNCNKKETYTLYVNVYQLVSNLLCVFGNNETKNIKEDDFLLSFFMQCLQIINNKLNNKKNDEGIYHHRLKH